ncbi:MAG: hypothetical protein Q8K60_01400 [Parachlamydiaceae bacterium]|nr:hypothetical protein [Parachlamydiaceae bacterium]
MTLYTIAKTAASICASSIPAAAITGASFYVAHTKQGHQALGRLGVNYFSLGAHTVKSVVIAGYLTAISIKGFNHLLDCMTPAKSARDEGKKNDVKKEKAISQLNWKPYVKNTAAFAISTTVFLRFNSNFKDWKSLNTLAFGGAVFFTIQKSSDFLVNSTVDGYNRLNTYAKDKYSEYKNKKTAAAKKAEEDEQAGKELLALLNTNSEEADIDKIKKFKSELEEIAESKKNQAYYNAKLLLNRLKEHEEEIKNKENEY